MRVVVTGGAGFIGGNLLRRLVEDPLFDEVVAVDDLSTGNTRNLPDADIEFVECSVLDEARLRRAFRPADAVVHLAAIPSVPRSVADPMSSHSANATGTVQVLEAARAAGASHMVVASSSSVYGSNPSLPKHEGLVTQPLSPYAVSKLATEQYALAWQHSYGLPTLAFRFFNVFGPLQPAGHAYAAVVPEFVSRALACEPIVVHGTGTQSRDFTYVGTVCGVIQDALHRRVTHPGPVNLAFGTRTTLLELIGMIEGLVGHSIERRHVETRVGDVPHSQADDALLRSLFPDVQPVSLEEGLEATVAWMRSHAS